MHTGGMHGIWCFFSESTKSMQWVFGYFPTKRATNFTSFAHTLSTKMVFYSFLANPRASLVIHFMFLPFLGRTIDIYIHYYICSNPAKTMQLKQLKVVHSKFTPNLKSFRSWWNLRQFYPFVLVFFRQTSPRFFFPQKKSNWKRCAEGKSPSSWCPSLYSLVGALTDRDSIGNKNGWPDFTPGIRPWKKWDTLW
jgi:hypothetical protein